MSETLQVLQLAPGFHPAGLKITQAGGDAQVLKTAKILNKAAASRIRSTQWYPGSWNAGCRASEMKEAGCRAGSGRSPEDDSCRPGDSAGRCSSTRRRLRACKLVEIRTAS